MERNDADPPPYVSTLSLHPNVRVKQNDADSPPQVSTLTLGWSGMTQTLHRNPKVESGWIQGAARVELVTYTLSWVWGGLGLIKLYQRLDRVDRQKKYAGLACVRVVYYHAGP